jgi:hypothetical protein
MPVAHYNLWIAFLKKEQKDYKQQQKAPQIKR